MGDRFQAGNRIRSRKTGEAGTIMGGETPPEGVQPVTFTESYTVQWDDGRKETLVHPDELSLLEETQEAKEPKGHYRTIGKNRFWCEPKKTSGIQDPTRRTFTDDDDNEYWCIPEDEVSSGRRYTSEGPKPPYPQPGVD